MNKLITGTAIATMLAAIPAFAADEAGMDEANAQSSSEFSEILNQEGQNREPGENGFQGKPVVEGPADWSNVHASGSSDAGSAASGESTGEAGLETEPNLETESDR